jgi:hypothetical protein
VVLDRAEPAAHRDPDRDRIATLPSERLRYFAELADDLVERRVDEAVELDLADRPVAAQARPIAVPMMPGLGQRGVDHPVLAEVLLQPVGDAEDAAELADVLAHDQDLAVGLHRLAQPVVQRLGEREGGHSAAPPQRSRGKPRSRPAGRRCGASPPRRPR